jgi:hypothetical protein
MSNFSSIINSVKSAVSFDYENGTNERKLSVELVDKAEFEKVAKLASEKTA